MDACVPTRLEGVNKVAVKLEPHTKANSSLIDGGGDETEMIQT